MFILYGATGFTGRLVARACVERGLAPVLAGRHADAVRAVADPLGLDARIGGLGDIDLTGASALLNCAGPFARTQGPLVEACLRAGVHYLDLAGEVEEHRALQLRDAEARAAGVLLLPGAGFGIVPSDCLAAFVSGLVERPNRVEIALRTTGGVSRGTAEVVLGNLRAAGVQRRGGALVTARAGERTTRVDFGDGRPSTVTTNPWRADLVAAVPGVPDLETLMVFPAPVRALMRIPHGGLLRALARRLPDGPSEAQIARGTSAVFARASAADGTTASAVLTGPDAYAFTGLLAAACLDRVEAGDLSPGFHTPAQLWGPDLPLGLPGVDRRVLAP